MKTKILKAAAVLSIFMLAACATKPKSVATIDLSANAGQEIAQTRRDLDYEKANQLSLLAPDNFKKAEDKLQDAETDLAKNRSSQVIFEDLAMARGWLEDARMTGQRARPILTGPLDARANALTVFDPDPSALVRADRDLKDLAEKIEKNKPVSEREVTKLTAQYIEVERDRVTRTQLNPVEARIKQAKKMNAKKLAPKTLAQAEVDFEAAQKTLKIEPYDRSQVAERVQTANRSSSDLMSITSEVGNSAGRLTEQVVLSNRMKDKEMQMKQAESEQKMEQVKDRYESAREAASETDAENRRLRSQVGELKDASKPQAIMESLQKRIPPEEADILLSGEGKILLRVKDLQFKTNSADLTPAAAAKLSKVRSALNDINPRKILIEGHTDSIGSPEKNKVLSESRALTVATVLKADDNLKDSDFETKGIGSEKPLKQNTTKVGRAENRRVEITIDTQ